ncbi:MAG: carboxypeptidase M32 [Candidatus Heimdallarchaeota archaeon]|nr:carboxypeptidase M32 [Candidatus Heimdallarchaeota archaeon]
MRKSYNVLLKLFKEACVLEEVNNLLYWDRDVTMPKKGGKQRADQVALISELEHERRIDPRVDELLKFILNHEDYNNLSDLEKRNVFVLQREYNRLVNVPADFVGEFNKQGVLSNEAWEKAKDQSDFSIFLPELEKMVNLNKKYANYLNPEIDPYDALMDYSEPGMTQEKFELLVNPLKEVIVPLIKECQQSSHQPKKNILTRKVPIDLQKKLNLDVLNVIGYDFERGRLDETVHPFTSGSYDDVRITTKYFENNFLSALMSTMHEAGHGEYEHFVGKNGRYQPVGMWCSDGVHECSSRFYENFIGRSLAFWKFYLPKFKEFTGEIFTDVVLKDLVHVINQAEPSAIRADADELTYDLHIILRFELERDLMNGRIEVKDLPTIWNEKVKTILGYEVKNDAEGVLQDIHWSDGLMGYFPTYTLGNIYGAQIFNKLKEDIPDWEKEIEEGNLQKVLNWFRTAVHEKGNLLDSYDLIEDITGEKVSSKYLADYLSTKFNQLYKLNR